MYQIAIQRALKKAQAPANIMLRKWAKLALQKETKAAEMTIRLVSIKEMTELNLTYRRKSGPTNVLSFPFSHHPDITLDPPLLGDVIICPDVVNKEAEDLSIENTAHWAHIVIHGVLHLLGHDHVVELDALKMENLEIAILADLGFSNPYENGDDIKHYE